MALTTHILDMGLGQPAANVRVTVNRQTSEGWQTVANGDTNANGRIELWQPNFELQPGIYSLHFATKAYFAKNNEATFFPAVELQFEVLNPTEHYHVPLLLNRFGFTTYRGS